MAESSGKAFGRYMRTLRERRGLSLDDVRSLSQTFPETITKSYLSRCENGYHKLALAKLIPLSRIYEVPADAVLERMELDLELDRLGGSDTAAKGFAELADAMRQLTEHGRRWEAYACARDALACAAGDPVQSRYRDKREQVALATLNVSTMASSLGRNRYALHEALCVLGDEALTSTNRARTCDRVAVIYRRLALLDIAEQYSQQAIREAEAGHDFVGLAYMYSTRAHVALSRSDPHSAIVLFHKSHSLHRDLGNVESAAAALVSVSECHLDLRRMRAARRSCESALQLLQSEPRSLTRATALAVMGKIVEAEGHVDQAVGFWQEAIEVAKEYRDRVLKFKIDLMLFRRALSLGDGSSARAIQRRLRRVSPWIPAELKELTEFRELVRTGRTLT